MPLTLSATHPKARKPHRCDYCSGTIQPGTTYHRSYLIGDDGPYSWVTCEPCSSLSGKVWVWAGEPYEGICDEEFIEWAQEHLSDPDLGTEAQAYLSRRYRSGESQP